MIITIPATADCWSCTATAETNGDGDTHTTTHQPGCHHITELRTRFEAQP